jgi:hypothetical protein
MVKGVKKVEVKNGLNAVRLFRRCCDVLHSGATLLSHALVSEFSKLSAVVWFIVMLPPLLMVVCLVLHIYSLILFVPLLILGSAAAYQRDQSNC